jgi:hypothetical protein
MEDVIVEAVIHLEYNFTESIAEQNADRRGNGEEEMTDEEIREYVCDCLCEVDIQYDDIKVTVQRTPND